MRISDWSSDVCSSDLRGAVILAREPRREPAGAEFRRDRDEQYAECEREQGQAVYRVEPGVEPRVGEEDRDEQDRDRADLALDLFGQLAARHTGAEDEAAEHRVDEIGRAHV